MTGVEAIVRELTYEASASADYRLDLAQVMAALFRAGVVTAVELHESPGFTVPLDKRQP